MDTYVNYFSLKSIVSLLIRLRLSTATKRHKYAVLKKVFSSVKEPSEAVPGIVDAYLPPRRLWRRPDRLTRKGLSGAAIDEQSLRRTILPLLANKTYLKYPWGQKLAALYADLQERIAQEKFKLKAPEIRFIAKSGTKRRAITTYAELTDRVLLALTTRYLSQSFDPHFSEHSYAFRSNPEKSHTKAMIDLLAYQEQMAGRPLYVAECDIQSFFDTIQHDVMRSALEAMCCPRAEAGEDPIAPAALNVVEQYLNSYNFYETIAENIDPAVQLEVKDLSYLSREKLQSLFDQTTLGKTGIPQGGALSPFLANCVLDQVDRAVLETDDPDLFYARFCDDMIIVHPDKEACQAALERYCKALKMLKLPIHHVKSTPNQGAAFFNDKSKGPYLWDSLKQGGHPWLSFLGYHVKYDGNLRLRQAAVKKHEEKIERETKQVLRLVIRDVRKEGTDKSPRRAARIVNLVRGRLIAMGTGHQNERALSPEMKQLSWMDAFPLLDQNQYSTYQMRHLDRLRDYQLCRLKKRIRTAFNLDEQETALPEYQKPKGRTRFYGSPYSYNAALRDLNTIYVGNHQKTTETFYNER